MPNEQAVYILSPGRKIKLANRAYEVVRHISSGGSGDVYEVSSDNQSFALKVFFPHYQVKQAPLFGVSTPTAIDAGVRNSIRFQEREYALLMGLNHPNIVRVYDAGIIALQQSEKRRLHQSQLTELPGFVSEFIDGEPILESIQKHSLTDSEVSEILLRLIQALRYLHEEHHYMHTDIKSSNVLVRRGTYQHVLISR